MQNAVSSYVTSQFIASLPMIFVYIGAAIAAVIFFRRAPLASGMVLFAVALLALTTIFSIAFQAANIHAVTSGERRPSSQYVHQAIYFVFACFRAVATALLAAAAFVERPETASGTPPLKNPFLKS